MTLANLPMPDFLKPKKELKPSIRKRRKDKHEKAFQAYARWMAKPSELREPKTKNAFMRLWKLPLNYSHRWEKDEEFQRLRYKHFWDWMFGLLPDIAHAAFKRAMRTERGSSQDAKLLMELIGKKIDVDRPTQRVQPFFLVGVDQSKIEQLFTPREYVDAATDTLKLERKRATSLDAAPDELKVESA